MLVILSAIYGVISSGNAAECKALALELNANPSPYTLLSKLTWMLAHDGENSGGRPAGQSLSPKCQHEGQYIDILYQNLFNAVELTVYSICLQSVCSARIILTLPSFVRIVSWKYWQLSKPSALDFVKATSNWWAKEVIFQSLQNNKFEPLVVR